MKQLVLVFLLWLPLTVLGDEVEDQIAAGLREYQAHNLSAAVAELNFAVQMIQQQQTESLLQYLPGKLPGWTAVNTDQSTVPASVFGGGSGVVRNFTREDGAGLEISVVTESPMITGMLALFGNPMLAGMSGRKVKRIHGEKALLGRDDPDSDLELIFVLDGKMLVQLSGSGDVSEENLVAAAEKIDFEALHQLNRR
jgi:hypothetical protein